MEPVCFCLRQHPERNTLCLSRGMNLKHGFSVPKRRQPRVLSSPMIHSHMAGLINDLFKEPTGASCVPNLDAGRVSGKGQALFSSISRLPSLSRAEEGGQPRRLPGAPLSSSSVFLVFVESLLCRRWTFYQSPKTAITVDLIGL